MKQHPFIVIEGIDGSGKTTLVERLAREIPGATAVREPTGKPTGDAIRWAFQTSSNDDPEERGLDDAARAVAREYLPYLFAADRAVSLTSFIEPCLKRGLVVCDRYIPSTLAYQQGPTWSVQRLYELHKVFRVPDLVIHLSCHPEVAYRRVRDRNERRAVWETPARLWQIDVAYTNAYRILAENGWRDRLEFVTVTGHGIDEGDPSDVLDQQQVLDEVRKRISARWPLLIPAG